MIKEVKELPEDIRKPTLAGYIRRDIDDVISQKIRLFEFVGDEYKKKALYSAVSGTISRSKTKMVDRACKRDAVQTDKSSYDADAIRKKYDDAQPFVISARRTEDGKIHVYCQINYDDLELFGDIDRW